MKTKYKGKVPRTSGWQKQTEYDNLLSDLDVSSLKFLKFKYNKDIREFPYQCDLNKEDNQIRYKEMLQRKHMIDEELEQRNALQIRNTSEYFDPQTGLVLDEDGNAKYGISFNEDETGYIYHNLDGVTTEDTSLDNEEDEGDTIVTPVRVGTKIVGVKIKEGNRTNEEKYKEWNYWEEEIIQEE
jgi:hypothetical protein